MYVLDTDFIINYLKGKKENIEILIRLASKKDSPFFITSINHYELMKGCYKSNNFQKNYSLVSQIRDSVKILDFDENSSLIAAKLFYDLEKSGSIISEPDIMIASICISGNYTLITDNLKHFTKIKNLKLLK